MRSLTYKLAGIFFAMSLVPLFIGFNAALSLQTARDALNANDRALRNLNQLLAAAEDSIAESTRLQDSASAVTSQIASSQEDAYSALRNMGDRLLPKTFAIAQIRFSLADATSAERALLLALNMRHLELGELTETKNTQIHNVTAAKESIDSARATYLSLVGTDEEGEAWRAVEAALDAWWENHLDFMTEVANLEELVDDLVRGGPLFASSSRKAYDTIFVRGKAARLACETRIEVLVQTLSRGAATSVRTAVETQTKSHQLIQDLSRESEAATFRATSLSDQIARARDASLAASKAAAEALAGTSRRFWYIVLFSVVGVTAAWVLGLVLSRRITSPVSKMATHLGRIAQGDLTEDVPGKDRGRADEIGLLARSMQDMIISNRAELRMANDMARGDYTSPITLRSEVDQLGRALRTMLDTSNDTLHRVGGAVDRVGRGAQAVAEASRSLSQGAQTSAQAVEEISQTVNHVDGQAHANAANAQKANELATASRDAARRGYGAVTELVSAMGEIQEAGKKIASVAKLIDDIAFQTNLLALNAAVEAARAGRQGKGFSVVADEVRNLSGRSAKAARETSAMVAAMTGRMEAGALLADRTDSELREIVNATTEVARLFDDITGASNAQSLAMAQISQGLSQIDEVIQENTHNAARTASSAQALTRQAGELREMVARFRLLDDARREGRQGAGGGRGGQPAPVAKRTPGNPLLLSVENVENVDDLQE